MSRFGGASPFGVQLKSKKTTIHTGETVNAGFGVRLKKVATKTESTPSHENGSFKLKSINKDKPAVTANGSTTPNGETASNGYSQTG